MNSLPPSLTFRAATTQDTPILRELAERVWRACYTEMISAKQIEYMLGWMYSADEIARQLSGGFLWEVVSLDDVPVGYLALEFREEAFAELHKLYLLPECQGRGHGQAMLVRALALASERGFDEVRLRVNKQNHRAIRAYERAGFRVVDSLVADIGGGFVMDDHVLARAVR